MSKNIKGITVEIGGDTTKLGKALKNVDDQSRDLSLELRQVNKLLKLDPKNTELLAQKQKLLSEAVETTKKKLDTLRKAEEQVQAQFKRGEVSEAQVRALKREIIATTNKLESYKSTVKETTNDMNKMGKSAENLGLKLKDALKIGLTAVVTATTAVIGGLVGSAEASREYRTEMGKLDTAFTSNGHSSETAKKTYQALQGVLGDTGQAVEAANHLAKLTNNEKDLSTWTNIATGVYATFGASLPIENLTEASNETAKTGKLTGGLADALNWAGKNEEEFQAKLNACNSEQERQTLITETLNALYSESAEKYRETNAEVIRANEANEAWNASMAEIGGVVESVLTDIKLMASSLLSEFVPSIKEVTNAIRGLLNGDEGSAEKLGTALSNILTQLVTKILEIAPTLVNTAISLITTLVTTLISMLPQLVTVGIQLFTSLITGVSSAIPQVINAIVEMLPQLVNALISGIPQLLQGAIQYYMALVQAIPTVITALLKALPTIINAIINGLITAIPLLIQGAIQLFMAIIKAIPVIIKALTEALPLVIDAIIDGLLNALPMLLEGAVQLLTAIIQAIPLIIPILIRDIPIIATTIIATLISKIPDLIKGAFQLYMGLIKAIPKILIELVKQIPVIIVTIVDALISRRNKIKDVGKDLIRGLWDGIAEMGDWIGEKIKGFGENVLNGLKSFFGIRSPSTIMRDEIGRFISEGIAVGITENKDSPIDAIDQIGNDMLRETKAFNGATIRRQIETTFSGSVSPNSGILDRLDSILTKLEAKTRIVLDSGVLVGETIDQIDAGLASLQLLKGRGV